MPQDGRLREWEAHPPAPRRRARLGSTAGGGVNRAEPKPNSLGGKSRVPEGLTNKLGRKQWSRRYKFVTGAKDGRLKLPIAWAEAQEPKAFSIVFDAGGIAGAVRFGQHVYASLFMSTEVCAETHSVVDTSPGETGLRHGGDCRQRGRLSTYPSSLRGGNRWLGAKMRGPEGRPGRTSRSGQSSMMDIRPVGLLQRFIIILIIIRVGSRRTPKPRLQSGST